MQASHADRRADPGLGAGSARGRRGRPREPRALGRGGYPDKLAGDEIPLGARVIAVCDAFDAMTSGAAVRVVPVAPRKRSGSCSLPGTQFDPDVVDAFAEVQADLIAELVA